MNLPNKLTVLRICLIPFMMFFYFADFIPYGIGKILALVFFVVAAFTDKKKKKIVTNFGKFLDPIADKILTSTVFFMIIADGTIPNPWGAIIVTIIIAREFMVSALRLLAANKGVVLAADIWGKAKTMVQMIALPVSIVLAYIYTSGITFNSTFVLVFEIITYVLLGVATILTVISGINYLVKNKDCLKEDKKLESKEENNDK